MDPQLLALISVTSLALLSGGTLLYLFIGNRRSAQLIDSLGSGMAANAAVREMQFREGKQARTDFESLKEASRRRVVLANQKTWQDNFFRAGIFSTKTRAVFQLIRIVLPIFFAVVLGMASWIFINSVYSIWLTCGSVLLGIAIGMQLPLSYLKRRIENRSQDIMYYLPLVVDQLVIGVSGSLDIAPCIKSVVALAEERDVLNPVTELLRYVERYVKSGASLDEALSEIGALSGHTELKHAFLSLSQVAKHGGEVTRQLQELANAVSQQRETKIEARIKRLELEATGPVGLVFLAFLSVLLIGIGTQVMEVFQ